MLPVFYYNKEYKLQKYIIIIVIVKIICIKSMTYRLELI